MLEALIGTIIALFAFLGTVAGDAALPSLQQAQDTVVATLSEVDDVEVEIENEDGENSNSEEDNNEKGKENANQEENNDSNDNGKNNENNEDGNTPDRTQVAAYNTAAGFVLPTTIPQVAVDSSPVLIGCDEEGADCEDTLPGNSQNAQGENNTPPDTENDEGNGDNGNIGLGTAKEAKSNRP